MKDLHEINRRLFLKHLCASAATTALIGSGFKAGAQSHSMPNVDGPNTHNMLVFGEKTIYLSHLPMFDGLNNDGTDYTAPHRYQVILEATFNRGGQNLQKIYTDDLRKNASVRIYTLKPADFVLPRLSSGSPRLTRFKAKVFRGHLERGGRVVRGLDDIDVKITRVVHFRKFSPQANKPEQLKYLLFGSSQESFLAHYISKPPDFDQVLSVKVVGHRFIDAELSKGIEVTIPDKSNQASERLREAQQVTALTQPMGEHALKFTLNCDKEIYFEEGELLAPPTFEDTELEKVRG